MLHLFFKKGSKLQAVNYRPVSLTSKLFVHIICKRILAYLEDHKIFNDFQHSFRSCETQLVIIIIIIIIIV